MQLASLAAVALLGCCEPAQESPQLLWSSAPAPPGAQVPSGPAPADSILFAPPHAPPMLGNLVRSGRAFLLPAPGGDDAASGVGVLRLDSDSEHAGFVSDIRFPGTEPGLVRLPDHRLLLVTVEAGPGGSSQLVARRGSADGRTWEGAAVVSGRSGAPTLGSSRPCAGEDGAILLAAVWNAASPEAQVVCHASNDAGGSWSEAGLLPAADARDASLLPLAPGRLLLVIDVRGELASSVSVDAGRSWSAPRSLGVEALPLGFALVRDESGGEIALAWTDPAPDTTVALPALQALRCALSSDGGSTWRNLQPLVLWPGRVPVAPTVWFDRQRLVAGFVDASPPWIVPAEHRIVCLQYARTALGSPPVYESTRARFGVDPGAARTALRVLFAHTLARPTRTGRLFVEGYHMRSLVTAHEVFESTNSDAPEWFDSGAGLRRAVEWADTMVATQDTLGYWPIGYGAVFLADMAAALGLLPTLEPHVDAVRLERYESAVRRFTDAIAADGMLLPTGACGVGWWGTTIPRLRSRALREPYLVSTALAGIELHAWLYRRSGRSEDRDRALRALDFTLAAIQPDGSLRPGPRVPGTGMESRLTTAAYVGEGWMAADVLLGDAAVLERMRPALRPYVEWLLREQRPDGSWDSGAEGEFARTPAIVDFLVWYDERCDSRPEVRDAVRRAGLRLVDPAQWAVTGLFRAGNHHEVQRALAGRSLVALARERFVL